MMKPSEKWWAYSWWRKEGIDITRIAEFVFQQKLQHNTFPDKKYQFFGRKSFIDPDFWTSCFEFLTYILTLGSLCSRQDRSTVLFLFSFFGRFFHRNLMKTAISPRKYIYNEKRIMDHFPNPIKKHHTRFRTVNRKIKVRNGWKRLDVGYIPGFGAIFPKNCQTGLDRLRWQQKLVGPLSLRWPIGSERKTLKKVAGGAYGSFKDFAPKWGECDLFPPGFSFYFYFHHLTWCISGPWPKGQVSRFKLQMNRCGRLAPIRCPRNML